MSKRKRASDDEGASSATIKNVDEEESSVSSVRKSKELGLYFKSYHRKDSTHDHHLPMFQAVQQMTRAETVLYPGCHRHLTASLVFPKVTYLDCDKKVADLYTDAAAKQYVESNKVYPRESDYEFHCSDVLQQASLKKTLGDDNPDGHDLLISLSAGVLAAACSPWVKEGGHLLVNDSHCDARSIFVHHSDTWQLVAYWDGDTNTFSTDELDDCFKAASKQRRNSKSSDATSTDPQPLTPEQVQESLEIGAISKRSFRMVKDSDFFLFQKRQS